MPQHSLSGRKGTVNLGDGFTITLPAVRGTVGTQKTSPASRTRAFGEESFDAQLESAGLSRARVIEVTGTQTAATGRGARGFGEAPAPLGELRVPAVAGESAVVLMEDESGALHWILPVRKTKGARGFNGQSAGAAGLTFEIPIAPASTGSRGLVDGIKKTFKVFTFPIKQVEDKIGDIVAGFIRRWEAKHRPYLVCTYGPADYRDAHDKHAVTSADWTRLAGGRSLLFVHGTFSSCDAFFAITPDVMAELGRRYEGRLFAFNHPTMSADPAANARQLLDTIGTQSGMTIDIVCHSRGGLVAREIAEQGRAKGVNVGRIVMVGVPNGGTTLADKDHMLGLINRFTTIAKFVPNRAATIVVDALVAGVKVLAHALLDDMVGLKAMDPAAKFLQDLNGEPGDSAELFAIASNYEPPPGTPLFSLTRAEDAGIDLAFGQTPNDLVVPTEGAYAVAAAGFPVAEERRFLFAPVAGVIHTEYFSQADTLKRLSDWLQPGATRELAVLRQRGLSPQNLESLRPHVITMSNGLLSRRGDFLTTKEDVDAIFARSIPAWAKTQPPRSPLRIAIWAHGGLTNEKDGLEIAFKHVDWWKSIGVYPIYFVWETGLFDALGSLLTAAARASRAIGARDFADFTDGLIEGVCRRLRGDLIWGAMKTNAERASAIGGGAAYLAEKLKQFCDSNPRTELHAAGHSAGSIFHSHFLAAAKKSGVPAFSTLQLLAPALRVDAFKQRLLPLVGKSVQSVIMYSMADDYERRDNCLGIYHKSLLYLIYNALESEERAPLLGLQVAAANDPELKAFFTGTDDQRSQGTAIWSVTKNGDAGSTSRSTSHGGFDDDAATMTSVAARVLGAGNLAALKPYVGDARQGREWPLSPEIGTALWTPAPAPAPLAAATAPARPQPVAGPRTGGHRLALCIGIDKYPGNNALHGCVNDARQWKKTLEGALHFDRVDILVNEKATRNGIATAVSGLLADAKAGDTVVLHYSGHGTTLPDDDGDETDGTDEAMVPVDFNNAQFITDDDIRGFLLKDLQAGVSLTVFMDCCHSGTITRMFGRTAPRAEPGARARFIIVPPKIVRAYLALRPNERLEGKVRKIADRSILKWVNFSACDASEVAYEQNGKGDFTTRATALLSQGVGITNRAFQRRLVKAFGEQRRQTPQLDCPLNAEGLGLFQFVADEGRSPVDVQQERRSLADRRVETDALPLPYDRRSGVDRRRAPAPSGVFVPAEPAVDLP